MEGVVTNADTRAEELKNQGNEEFKKGNHLQAINFYSEAIGNHNFFYQQAILPCI